MKKRVQGRKFGRPRNQRHALMKGLSRALILRERINTTEAKARELRRYIEPVITRAQVDTVANRRHLVRFFDTTVVRKLMSDIGPRYKERKGGYTRITKRIPRKTDSARMAVIELV